MYAVEARRVLVLEDYPDLAGVLSDVLRARGFEVTTATSGIEGLLRITRERFALVLLDLDLPELSGMGVQRAMRDVSAAATIVMSGRAGPWKAEALEVGATACLSKPFDLDALVLMVERVLALAEPRQPWPADVLELGRADLARVQKLSPSELDELPFGAIGVDRTGIITAYNRYEETSVGRSAESVIGTRLRDLAPCLMVKEFLDALDEGRRCRELDTVLRFVFPFCGGWRAVNVRLYCDPPSESVWVFVAQRLQLH